jgi:hypothetical protein
MMKKEYLLSRGEETHTKKSAGVPKVEEPYYLCHNIFYGRFQKEAKQERHRQKVSPFNHPSQGDKFYKSSMR